MLVNHTLQNPQSGGKTPRIADGRPRVAAHGLVSAHEPEDASVERVKDVSRKCGDSRHISLRFAPCGRLVSVYLCGLQVGGGVARVAVTVSRDGATCVSRTACLAHATRGVFR